MFKNTEMTIIKQKHMQNQTLHKNLLYNIFAPVSITEQKVMMTNQMISTIDIAVEAHHETHILTRALLHSRDITPHLEV